MRIVEKKYDHHLHIWVMVCHLCGEIKASASEKDLLPESSYCSCDKNGNKSSTFEVFELEGKTMIRRNKFPRFIGEITMGQLSDIENVGWIDECPDFMTIARTMRLAGEFLRKSNHGKENTE